MNRINRTSTVLGEAALATLVSTPISQVSILKERQAIIQFFLSHPEQATCLKGYLKNYQAAA